VGREYFLSDFIDFYDGVTVTFKFVLALAVVSLLSTVASKASTYDVTLLNSSGVAIGSGQFGITGNISSTGLTNFGEGSNLNSLDFKIGGHDFTLGNDLLPAVVTFDKGSLVSIAYLGVLGNFQFDLGTLGLSYTYISDGIASFGTISTGSSGVSTTPLPPSWTLMLLGLVGFGVVAYRRKNRVELAAA
jgi:hypothetical protein